MMFIKPWSPFFDPKIENMTITPVWVKLPGFSTDFWSYEVFKEIENAIRAFMEENMGFLVSRVIIVT
jgi:hypothetical protein